MKIVHLKPNPILFFLLVFDKNKFIVYYYFISLKKFLLPLILGIPFVYFHRFCVCDSHFVHIASVFVTLNHNFSVELWIDRDNGTTDSASYMRINLHDLLVFILDCKELLINLVDVYVSLIKRNCKKLFINLVNFSFSLIIHILCCNLLLIITTTKPDFTGEINTWVLTAWAIYKLVTIRSVNKWLKSITKLNKY
jgi:hypothetical protein